MENDEINSKNGIFVYHERIHFGGQITITHFQNITKYFTAFRSFKSSPVISLTVHGLSDTADLIRLLKTRS
ncbi:hypothetical protein BH23THE1_BH23THE1_20430 [soil metagenome]